MAHVLTPAATFDSVTVPDAGDNRTAASVEVGFQACTNRSEYVNVRVSNLLGVAATFSGDVTIGSGNDFICHSPATFTGTVTFNAATTFNDPATFADGATVNNLTCALATCTAIITGVLNASAATVAGALTVGGVSNFTAPCRMPQRVTLGADAPASYSAANWDRVFTTASSLTAARVYTIDDTGCVDGDVITFFNAHATYTPYINSPAAVLLATLSQGDSVACARVGGVWYVVGR